MTKLKNITSNSVTLQMFNTVNPEVNNVSNTIVVTFQPGEVKDETTLLVTDPTNASYNADIIDNYINKGILTRLLN